MAIDHASLAETYFHYVNEKSAAQIAQMFTPDGAITMPDGRHFCGHKEIHNLYAGLFSADAPAPQLINSIGSGLKIATEMVVNLADGSSLPAADFFDLNPEGLIVNLRIYAGAIATTEKP